MRILLIGLILALFTVAGCGKKTDEPIFTEDKPDTTATSEGTPISKEVIGDILQQIPSPLEISVLLKESGKKYNPSITATIKRRLTLVSMVQTSAIPTSMNRIRMV